MHLERHRLDVTVEPFSSDDYPNLVQFSDIRSGYWSSGPHSQSLSAIPFPSGWIEMALRARNDLRLSWSVQGSREREDVVVGAIGVQLLGKFVAILVGDSEVDSNG